MVLPSASITVVIKVNDKLVSLIEKEYKRIRLNDRVICLFLYKFMQLIVREIRLYLYVKSDTVSMHRYVMNEFIQPSVRKIRKKKK